MTKVPVMVSLNPEIVEKARAKQINFSKTLNEALSFLLSDTSPIDERIFRATKEADRLHGEANHADEVIRGLHEVKAKQLEADRVAIEKAAQDAKRAVEKRELIMKKLIEWTKAGEKINWPFYLENHGIMEEEVKKVITCG